MLVPTLEYQSNHVKKTIDQPAENSPPVFPFLQLPRELRDHIYTHILVPDKQPLRLIRRPNLSPRRETDITAFLATNRQVYAEASRVFLSGNEFLVRGTVEDYNWLEGLGVEGQNQLRKVTFLSSSLGYSTLNLLSGCSNLSLTVQVHYFQLANLDQMGLFKNLHEFSRATIERNGQRGCEAHEHGSYRLDDGDRKVDNDLLDKLSGQLASACPNECRLHKESNASNSTATVHLLCDYGCEDCYWSRFSNWQWQWHCHWPQWK